MLEEEYESRRRLPRALRPRPRPEAEFSFGIRRARAADLPEVKAIYDFYLRNSTVTFGEKVKSHREWRSTLATTERLDLPFLVAETRSGELLGYALVLPWQARASYRATVEDSIYLGPAATGKGLGRLLLTALVDACRDAGIREIVAVIADSGADASIRLHAALGFKEIGRMGRIAFKADRWLGTVTMQKSLKSTRRRRRTSPPRAASPAT